MRQINITSDITGAGPDTLKKAPATKRCLNPLQPDYVVPGAGERPVDNLNDPYGVQNSSMGAANFKVCQE